MQISEALGPGYGDGNNSCDGKNTGEDGNNYCGGKNNVKVAIVTEQEANHSDNDPIINMKINMKKNKKTKKKKDKNGKKKKKKKKK